MRSACRPSSRAARSTPFRRSRSTGLTSEEFSERLLYEQKVAVVPGSAFGPSGEGHVRATAGDQLRAARRGARAHRRRFVDCGSTDAWRTRTDYEAVIGIEIHVQLKTASKMFCRCSTDVRGAPPNTHTCPVCLGLPGALPVINRRAVEHVLATGMAIGATTPDVTRWDRKNYFYPDLPKGYQISQYDLPLASNGR